MRRQREMMLAIAENGNIVEAKRATPNTRRSKRNERKNNEIVTFSLCVRTHLRRKQQQQRKCEIYQLNRINTRIK